MNDNLFADIILEGNEENIQLPSPQLLNFYRDIKNRIFWIETDIDDNMMDLQKYIIEWNKKDYGIPVEDRTPIKLMFYTNGGDLDVNNALIDIIKISRTPIYGYNMGKCCSAGAFIFLSCHKRYMLNGAYFLIHQGEAVLGGTHSQTKSQMEDYEYKIENLTKMLVEKMNLEETSVRDKVLGEWYFYKEDAIKYQIVDSIIESLDDICI